MNVKRSIAANAADADIVFSGDASSFATASDCGSDNPDVSIEGIGDGDGAVILAGLRIAIYIFQEFASPDTDGQA